jgi:hypothetical protein
MRKKGKPKNPLVLHEATGPLKLTVPRYPLLVVPDSGLVIVAITSERLEKYATHWHHATGRVVWCPGQEQCEHCHEGWESRVVAYACCVARPQRKQYLLALPQSGWTHCPELVEADGDLRGRTYSVQRLTRSRFGPVKVVALAQRLEEESLHSPFDIREEIGRRFGIRTS